MTVPFLPDIKLKPDAATQKLAFIGISGSGKTYGAGRFVEHLLDTKAQVIVLDVVGNWWGLRLRADGKAAGYAIPVLGGVRGDIPIESTAGRQVAELVAESRSSMVLDVSDFTLGELRRFVEEFAIALLRAKKLSPSPVMVVWEECQDMIPQRVDAAAARMLGAVERLIKKGRNYGVGTTLISQRPQAINKDALNQIETLFCFRTGGPQERKAIEGWVTHQGVDVGKLLAALPSLATGEAFCWSPQWLGVLERVKVTPKKTLDNSSTPKFDAAAPVRELAPIDLEAFQRRMAVVIEVAKANDPKELRKRIQELRARAEKAEEELKNRPSVVPERVEVPVLHAADIERLELAIQRLDSERDRMAQAQQVIVSSVGILADSLKLARNQKSDYSSHPLTRKALRPTGLEPPSPYKPSSPYPAGSKVINRKTGETLAVPASTAGMTRPKRYIIEAIASFAASGITAPRRANVAVAADQSPRSSGYTNNLSALRTEGLVEYPGPSSVALTDAGRAMAHGKSPMDLFSLHSAWQAKLTTPQWRILVALIDEYPDDISRELVAHKAGQSPKSSGYTNNLSALRSLGLVDYPSPGTAVATDLICPAELTTTRRAK